MPKKSYKKIVATIGVRTVYLLLHITKYHFWATQLSFWVWKPSLLEEMPLV